jgi:hypothetical protein
VRGERGERGREIEGGGEGEKEREIYRDRLRERREKELYIYMCRKINRDGKIATYLERGRVEREERGIENGR